MAMLPGTLPWRASSQASLPLAMPLPHRPLQRQNLLKMQPAYGTTHALKAVLVAVARRLPVRLAAQRSLTTQPITHLQTLLPRRWMLLGCRKGCQLRQLAALLRHRRKHRNLRKTLRVYGIIPVVQVVLAVLAVPLLAQNVARLWRTTRRITSNRLASQSAKTTILLKQKRSPIHLDDRFYLKTN